MLTHVVRISLLIELIAWAAIATWLHQAYGFSVASLVAGAAAAMVGARLALVCLTVILGWAYRSERAPAQRLGPGGIMRLVATECLALLADNFWYLPFESLALRIDPVPPAGTRVAVVLVHGYLSNRGYFAPMVRWLEARGVAPVIVPNYRSVFSNVESGAGELHAAIERLAAGGVQQVVLVCHSMGGLLARRYLQDHGEARVARLVTIASPHHGTVLSRMGIGEHARQMRQGSDFLEALDAAERAKPPGVPATSIYSVHDNLVAPQDTSRLDWARNVAVAGIGHVGIVAHEPVYALVLEELRAAKAA
jgi:triacylglycerol esterase/lipase EstA (alpha/beta hydrolase family)